MVEKADLSGSRPNDLQSDQKILIHTAGSLKLFDFRSFKEISNKLLLLPDPIPTQDT